MTNQQYEVFLRATRLEKHHYWRDRRYWRDPRFNQSEQPVVGVSWLAGKAFCRWLSEASGRSIDLPTEAQWEFAARGVEGRQYPWGDEKPDERRAWFGKNWEVATPLAVGSLPGGRGPYGHLDLAGNIWEWCQDAWDAKAYWGRGELTADPAGPSAAADDPDVLRACRGGAFGGEFKDLCCAYRGRGLAGGKHRDRGFRVAAVPVSR